MSFFLVYSLYYYNDTHIIYYAYLYIALHEMNISPFKRGALKTN